MVYSMMEMACDLDTGTIEAESAPVVLYIARLAVSLLLCVPNQVCWAQVAFLSRHALKNSVCF